MDISFKQSFVKDFKALPLGIKIEVRKICSGAFPSLKSVFDFKDYPTQFRPL